MTRGVNKVNYGERASIVHHNTASNRAFLYEPSLEKDSKWNIGDRYVAGDGREFVYSRSSSALITPMAASFTDTGVISFTSAVIAAAVGDVSVVVPAATHSALVLDELRGGFIVIFKAGVIQQRGIIGNTVSAANAAVTIYLDGPLDATVTTSSAYEVYANPYSALNQAASAKGKAGVPAVAVSATLMYFWCQVKGPIFINPQSTVTAKEGTGCMFRNDGSLEAVATAIGGTVPSSDTTQYAGFVIAGTADGNGPLFMLQG